MSDNDVKKLQALGFYREIDIQTGDDEQYGQAKEEIEKLNWCATYL